MKRKELWNEHGMRVDEEGRVLGDHPEELTAEDEALLDEVEDRLNAERNLNISTETTHGRSKKT